MLKKNFSTFHYFDNFWTNSYRFIEKSNSLKKSCLLIYVNEKYSTCARKKEKTSTKIPLNEVNIKMLPENIFKKLFKSPKFKQFNEENIKKACKELKKHKLLKNEESPLEDINLSIPKIYGDIENHFYAISEQQSKPYRELLDSLIDDDIPPKPKSWSFIEGWSRYDESGVTQVLFPEEQALILDIEVCCNDGDLPTLATAVSSKAWYCWISKNLINATSPVKNYYQTEDLIPLESTNFSKHSHANKPRIVVGHNVSFDRARIKEQYWLNKTLTRFMDTMSLHVCVSGITSFQRNILKSKKELDEPWTELSSLNALDKVFQLYCNENLDKKTRDIFVTGTISDIKNDFQNLTTYCANDVIATFKVFKEIWPLFKERFPHPVTLAGILELSIAYLPVNSNWKKYKQNSQTTYEDVENEAKFLLMSKANKACKLLQDEKYKEDLWMWDQDWSVQEIKMKKLKLNKKSSIPVKSNVIDESDLLLLALKVNEKSLNDMEKDLLDLEEILNKKSENILATKENLPKRLPFLPGYPAWYRKLCEKNKNDNEWIPGPHLITTSMQITPKLLGLTWESYPLHYIRDYGWGFLIPYSQEATPNSKIPIKQLIERYPPPQNGIKSEENKHFFEVENLSDLVSQNIHAHDYNKRMMYDDNFPKWYKGTGVIGNINIDDCCWFLKLPHKDGTDHRVGNPLAKDFLNKFSENVLSGFDKVGEQVLSLGRMLSYWRNNRERIEKQMVVRLSSKELPRHLRGTDMEYGAILPQLVVAGTLTRRAVESTWMTSSNVHKDRIGSELRSMIQAPPGYRLVGADVDSQELWIASLLGDAYFAGIHGSTPFGWMTLSGSKANATDMHSVTAREIGISRDQAKVINYARIYGAGLSFAVKFLKQFNPSMPISEIKSKAMKMFTLTKGKKIYKIKEKYKEELEEKEYKKYEAMRIQKIYQLPLEEIFDSAWVDGTESAMFNRLESIANSDEPSTPFLKCRLSRALDPHDPRHLPTRVNWVVQSGAVDFLHLMLVSMCWLEPRARFSISFHDEVRYLVPKECSYRAALALHATNLFARSFCASRVGLINLPRSVAFFSSVEIDKCWRKDATSEYITPSNPHGLSKGYEIPIGESLDIYDAITKAGSRALIKGYTKYDTNN